MSKNSIVDHFRTELVLHTHARELFNYKSSIINKKKKSFSQSLSISIDSKCRYLSLINQTCR